MLRYSLKDILRGITLASLGFGMLAIAFQGTIRPTSKELMLLQEFLVAFGGTLVGYGLAFPLKWPPHRYVLAMVGMFAAQAWQSGSSVGLLVYVGLLPLLGFWSRAEGRGAGARNNSRESRVEGREPEMRGEGGKHS